MMEPSVKIYFSDYFEIDPQAIEKYGALNISLVADLPLFIDPFLLFNSKNPTYKKLHAEIIRYLSFLRGKSSIEGISEGLIMAWYRFPEVSQNWLGYSKTGNRGSGLGPTFANSLNQNLHKIFKNFGSEQITKSSHLEKLCLVQKGVGKDNISDFTTNLIKKFLLEYTQEFALKNIAPKFLREFSVGKTCFNYETETWETQKFNLPPFNGDFVLLTPKDILTRDDIWINKSDLLENFSNLPSSVPDEQLRSQINRYFLAELAKSSEPSKEDKMAAAFRTVQEFPELFDYYIKQKEERGDQAVGISHEKVKATEELFIAGIKALSSLIQQATDFYKIEGNTYDEAMARVGYLKDVIENQDGYRAFYRKEKPITREEDLQLMYKLVWRGSPSDVNREVNNGRGPVDFKISRGGKDTTLVEFKLASNSQLKKNLEKQLEIYKQANNTKQGITVILYTSLEEHTKVVSALKAVGKQSDPNIVLIDARKDNKLSASKA